MGTRADFYTKSKYKPLRQEDWIGSIAWDGYPDGIPNSVKDAKTKEQFLTALKIFAKKRDDWTSSKDGWPWPWNDSGTTGYGYVFNGDKVSWNEHKWPNMENLKNVQFGKKSGLIVITERQN